jgi:hypothetical protein
LPDDLPLSRYPNTSAPFGTFVLHPPRTAARECEMGEL